MPGFKYKGKYLAGYNAFKNHLSFFPTALPIETLKNKLGDYKISEGTIQFTLTNPIADELIRELVRIKVASIDE
jgi:uncharacterized protein YdhG (YjbR/CyaY superfamily)